MSQVVGLAFGEFDIDKGSVCRSVIGEIFSEEEESYVAEQLLPDGCEKFACSRSLFLLRRAAKGVRIDISGPLFILGDSGWHIISEREDIIRIEKGGLLNLVSPSSATKRWRCSTDRHIQRGDPDAGQEELCLQVASSGGSVEMTRVRFVVSTEMVAAVIAAWESTDTPVSESPMLYGVTCTLTKKDIDGKRGGINKSVALLGRDAPLLLSLWPLIYLICDQYCDMRDPNPEVFKSLFEWLQSCVGQLTLEDLPMTSRSQVLSIKSSAVSPSSLFEMRLPTVLGELTVCKAGLPWEYVTLPNFGVADLCLVFREKLAYILTGILCGRRIIVKSHRLSATEVSEAALAIGIIGSFINPSFIPDQVFPYTSLSFQGAFLDSGEAFVVGTMNPMYDAQPQWWDVLCDLDSGDIKVGVSTAALVEEGTAYFEEDKKFMNDIVQLIRQRSVFLGFQRLDVEMTVRDMLKEYMTTILCSAISVDESNRGTIDDIRIANTDRLLLSQFCSVSERFECAKFHKYSHADKDAAVSVVTSIATLRRLGCSSSSLEVLGSLQNLLRRVDDQVFHELLLESLPHTLGGLAPIAVHIMCPDPAVRVVAVAVLQKIERFGGKLMLQTLSSFLLLAYEQAKNDLWDTVSC